MEHLMRITEHTPVALATLVVSHAQSPGGGAPTAVLRTRPRPAAVGQVTSARTFGEALGFSLAMVVRIRGRTENASKAVSTQRARPARLLT